MKKWIKITIIVVVALAFFFPKSAGVTGRPGVQPFPQTWTDKKCSCLGYKSNATPELMDAPHSYLCIGIPYSCECTKHTYNSNEEKISEQVTCKE